MEDTEYGVRKMKDFFEAIFENGEKVLRNSCSRVAFFMIRKVLATTAT